LVDGRYMARDREVYWRLIGDAAKTP
jgi:hypothetical protein